MTDVLTMNRRMLARLCLAFALIFGALPFVSPVSAQGAVATGPLTPVEITFTTTEVLDHGQEWMDAEGNIHFRNATEINVISGSIEGEALFTFGGDGIFAEGAFYLTVSVDITTESGSWDGYAGFIISEATGEYESAGAILVGRGGNAGKVIALDTVVTEDDDGATIVLAGTMLTMGGPHVGVHLNYDLCFTGPDSASGGFLSFAPFSDAGSVSADFHAVGTPDPRVITGNLTFESEHGTLNAMIVEANSEGTPHNFGYFVLMGGTGDYADLYGWGHTNETVSFGEDGGCAGPAGTFYGEALVN